MTTKSGTNDFHGSLFEFFRNTDLDARSFFATSTEKFNLNQFGGSLGGALQKDKTFFFADYQAKMQRHGIPFTGLVPTAAMREGDFTDDAFGNPRVGLAEQSLRDWSAQHVTSSAIARATPFPWPRMEASHWASTATRFRKA